MASGPCAIPQSRIRLNKIVNPSVIVNRIDVAAECGELNCDDAVRFVQIQELIRPFLPILGISAES